MLTKKTPSFQNFRFDPTTLLHFLFLILLFCRTDCGRCTPISLCVCSAAMVKMKQLSSTKTNPNLDTNPDLKMACKTQGLRRDSGKSLGAEGGGASWKLRF